MNYRRMTRGPGAGTELSPANDDDAVVKQSVRLATDKTATMAQVSLLRAMVSTRPESRRVQMAQQAREQLGVAATEIALDLLRLIYATPDL